MTDPRNTAASLLPEIGANFRNENAGFSLEPPGINGSQDEMIIIDHTESNPQITDSVELPIAVLAPDKEVDENKEEMTASAELPMLVAVDGKTLDVPQ